VKKIKIIFSGFTLFLIPFIASAQSLQGGTLNLKRFFMEEFLRGSLVLAFLFFAVNAIRFFVMEATEEEGRRKAKTLAIYGIAAVVFILSFFGLIMFLTESVGLEGQSAPKSDYEVLHTP